ncbi:hypothetical protein NDU88_006546 [Pleurodeles waltl]|uniref:Transmembrane protein n=1 Tax=Pleurodeles waltl TaxID=8319 RepID=A0AAV7TXJ4_PLEWA|nr:hypothetical protein NDU88_006546 [Pleurodeles waltl]
MARESVRLLHTLAAHPQQKTTKVPRDFKYSSSGGALSRSKCPKAMKPKTQAITIVCYFIGCSPFTITCFVLLMLSDRARSPIYRERVVGCLLSLLLPSRARASFSSATRCFISFEQRSWGIPRAWPRVRLPSNGVRL